MRRDGELIATLDAPIGADDQDHRRRSITPARTSSNSTSIRPPNALTPLDAKAVATIEGVRDKLRVLLVSGEPHPGERMWRNLLKSDANVDLVHFTILRPPEKTTDGTPINELSLIAFPVADLFGRKIKDFDLIIFDRYSSQAILPRIYLDNIVRYVREGGALLIAAGPGIRHARRALFHAARRDRAGAARPGTISRARSGPAISQRRRTTSGHARAAGAESDPPGWGQWFRSIGAEASAGATVHGRPRQVAAAATGARRQGPRRRCCSPTRCGCGRAATTAAARIWICCAASRTG